MHAINMLMTVSLVRGKRLPKGWLDYLKPAEQKWIGQGLVNDASTNEDRFKQPIQLWYHPPKPEYDCNVKMPGMPRKKCPDPESF